MSTKLQASSQFNQTNPASTNYLESKRGNNDSLDYSIIVLELQAEDQSINLTSFLNNPRTKALRDLHEMTFEGEWDLADLQSYDIFGSVLEEKRTLRMKFITDIVSFYKGKCDLILTKGYWNSYPGPRKTGIQLSIIDGEYSDDRKYLFKLNDNVAKVFDIETL